MMLEIKLYIFISRPYKELEIVCPFPAHIECVHKREDVSHLHPDELLFHMAVVRQLNLCIYIRLCYWLSCLCILEYQVNHIFRWCNFKGGLYTFFCFTHSI